MTKHHRGYILMEVCIGGALVAILCATVLSSLADARKRNVVAGRDVVATQLAQTKIEQQRALGFAIVGTDPGPSCSAGGVVEPNVAGPTGVYSRTCKVGASTSVNINGVTVNCKTIDVDVQFTANPLDLPRKVQLRSKVCQ